MRMSRRAMRTFHKSVPEWLIDEIAFWRPSGTDLDENTLVEHNVPGRMVWQGPARVTPTRGPREQAVAEGVITMRDADFLIPHTAPLPWRDDEVQIISSGDFALVGRWFRITDVRVFSQQAARRFSAVQAQPSRQWDLGEVEVGP